MTREEALAIVLQRGYLWREDHTILCPEGSDCPQLQAFDAAVSLLKPAVPQPKAQPRLIWVSWI